MHISDLHESLMLCCTILSGNRKITIESKQPIDFPWTYLLFKTHLFLVAVFIFACRRSAE